MDKTSCSLASSIMNVAPSGKIAILICEPKYVTQLSCLFGRTEKNMVAVIAMGYDTERKLIEKGIPFRHPEDYLSEDILKKAEREAFKTATKWYQNRAVEKYLLYKKMNFGRLVEHEMSIFFIDALKCLETVNRIVEIERPSLLILLADRRKMSEGTLSDYISYNRTFLSLIPAIVETCAAKKIPLVFQEKSVVSKIKESLSRMQHATQAILGYIINPIVTLVLLRLYEKSSYSIRAADKSNSIKNVLIFEAKKLVSLVEELQKHKEKRMIFVGASLEKKRLEKSNPFLLFLGTEVYKWLSAFGVDPFIDKHTTKNVYMKFVRASILWKKNWKKIRENQSFTSFFTYNDLSLWNMFEKKFATMFLKRFPEIAKLVEVVNDVIERESIDIIVSWSDVAPAARAVVTAGKMIGIPALVVQHGVTGLNIGYVPLTASKMAIWGKASEKWLVERGIDQQSLVITGNPEYDVLKDGEFYRELGLDLNRNVIVLATQPLLGETAFDSMREKNLLLRSVVEAMRDLKDMQLVVKLHPQDENDSLHEIAKDIGVNFTVTKHFLYELLQACQLMITVSSTVGLEAMLFNKPVVVANLLRKSDPVSYVKSGAAVPVYDSNHFASTIKKCLYDPQTKRQLEESRKKFVHEYVGQIDGKASLRVVNLINRMITENTEKTMHKFKTKD